MCDKSKKTNIKREKKYHIPLQPKQHRAGDRPGGRVLIVSGDVCAALIQYSCW